MKQHFHSWVFTQEKHEKICLQKDLDQNVHSNFSQQLQTGNIPSLTAA